MGTLTRNGLSNNSSYLKKKSSDAKQKNRLLIFFSEFGFYKEKILTYFRHLLRAVPARSALCEFLLIFSYSKNCKFICRLGGFNIRITLYLSKHTLFGHTARMPEQNNRPQNFISINRTFQNLPLQSENIRIQQPALYLHEKNTPNKEQL